MLVTKSGSNELTIKFEIEADYKRVKGALSLAKDIGYDFPVINMLLGYMEQLQYAETDSNV